MADGQEVIWLWSGVICYAVGLLVFIGRENRSDSNRFTLWSLAAGVVLFAIAIFVRWQTTGHGPFLSMYEILLSNLFSLGFVFLIISWWVPLVRTGSLGVLGVFVLLGVWAIIESPTPTVLPPTYDNYWLWIHVTFGKIFLGTCLASVGLAMACLFSKDTSLGAAQVINVSDMDNWVWRLLAIAFVFHSLMLIAGAVWAQDAWGRYWDWDPLETWAFVTWLSIAALLHLRITFRIPLKIAWMGVLGVFALAFFTFFGVPFISLAPHKGAV